MNNTTEIEIDNQHLGMNREEPFKMLSKTE